MTELQILHLWSEVLHLDNVVRTSHHAGGTSDADLRLDDLGIEVLPMLGPMLYFWIRHGLEYRRPYADGVEGILIPVKPFGESKKRLSSLLTQQQRRRLSLAMVADVLRATEKWPNRLLVTSDPDAEAVGLAFGCELVPDLGQGLNAAIAFGTLKAIEMGITSLLVLPSDVPLVTSDDIAFLFADLHEVVVAPSNDGGTNALRRCPPDAIQPAFGPSSARAHEASAAEAGLGFKMIDRESLLFDVDRYEDLEALAGDGRQLESVKVASVLIGQSRVGG